MQERKAAGITPPIFDRIFARIGDPENIHFHFKEFFRAAREQDVVAASISESREFMEMGVIAKLNSARERRLAALVKEFGAALPLVGIEYRVIADNDILQSVPVRHGKRFLPIGKGLGNAEVAARSGKAGRAQISVQCGGFQARRDFNQLITGCGDFLERFRRVFGEELANRINFEPNGAWPGEPPRSARCSAAKCGGSGNSSHQTSKKIASRRHRTPSFPKRFIKPRTGRRRQHGKTRPACGVVFPRPPGYNSS